MAAILKFRNATGHVRTIEEIPAYANAMHSSFEERAWAMIQRSDVLYGDPMPWPKTHDKIRFRPHEVSAWIGPNGDGKSLALGYVAAHWALQETPVLICSLELDVGIQLKRLARQLLCTAQPKRSDFEMLLARLVHLNFLDFVGHKSPHEMLRIVRETATCFRHIVIDNLTLIVPPGRNTDEAAVIFVRNLVEIARDTGCHVHLVGHIRKPDAVHGPPTRYDWRGSGACADLVHNVLIVYGNDKKRMAEEKGDPKHGGEPDVTIAVDKQRNGEYRGRIGFWWRPAALQLVQHLGDDAVRFDPHDFSLWER
jgi:twinkle protein